MILFSQVREDPSVELNAIKLLNKNNLNVFIIASGGCTLLTLASLYANHINKVDALDINVEQIYLTQLKMALFYNLDKDKYLEFIEGRLDKYEIMQIFESLPLSNRCRKYWSENKDQLSYGINNIGKYEQLFRELKLSNFDYEKIFDKNYLSSIFGDSAVKHSNITSFSEHFEGILQIYKIYHDQPSDNYFYNQIINNNYQGDMPLYIKNYDNKNNLYVKYINNNLISYMKHNKEKYDFIHISNVTDWMDETHIINLLYDIHQRLIINGLLIIRRLNSDVIIKDILNKIKIYEIVNINTIDKTYFYKEVIVARAL